MLLNYVKVAIRVLLRRKFYTFVSLFGIAFTLLILNVMVSFMDHMFSAEQPESRLDRILSIESARMAGEHHSSRSNAGYALLDQYARDLPGVELFSVTTGVNTVVGYVDGEKVQPSRP